MAVVLIGSQEKRSKMSCPKCGGNLLGKSDDFYCLQCGWRPGIKTLQQIERNRVRTVSPVPFEGLVEEYLNETNNATEKAKHLLYERKDFIRMLEHLWHQENLAQRFTMKHFMLLECYSAFDVEIADKLQDLESVKFLSRYRLDMALNRPHRLIGGRSFSAKVTDLALKMVLCASYQWLRTLEVEREVAKSRPAGRGKARTAAYMSMKNAHRLARRILFALGPDIDLSHAILTRALWEDKYPPIVIAVKGIIADVTY